MGSLGYTVGFAITGGVLGGLVGIGLSYVGADYTIMRGAMVVGLFVGAILGIKAYNNSINS